MIEVLDADPRHRAVRVRGRPSPIRLKRLGSDRLVAASCLRAGCRRSAAGPRPTARTVSTPKLVSPYAVRSPATATGPTRASAMIVRGQWPSRKLRPRAAEHPYTTWRGHRRGPGRCRPTSWRRQGRRSVAAVCTAEDDLLIEPADCAAEDPHEASSTSSATNQGRGLTAPRIVRPASGAVWRGDGRHGNVRPASNVRRAMAATTSPLTPEDVMALVEERNIRFIRLWFTDILGQLKAFSINATELTDAFEGGMGFDGSSITGFNPIEESDMIAMPDPSDVPRPALAARGGWGGADVLRHPHAGADAVRGRPAACAAPGARPGQGDGLRPLLRGARARVLLLPQLDRRPRCWTRAATST